MPQLRGRLLANQSLAELTWFRVGGPAQVLFTPADEDDLAYFLKHLPKELPVYVVGVGSNLIVRDGGMPGVVIRLSPRGVRRDVRVDGDIVSAGAAALDKRVAETAAAANIGGMEFFFGIPGTIGGALRMNAGANGGETKDVLIEAVGIGRDGTRHVFGNADMKFVYRNSGVDPSIIFTSARFRGAIADAEAIRARMNEVQTHRETAQPIREKTGGSTFKNPPGNSAWKLIDAAGCRGLRVGGAQVSEMHCNFLINTGNATGHDIETLGETVRERVKANSGIELHWEIKRIGTSMSRQSVMRRCGSPFSSAAPTRSAWSRWRARRRCIAPCPKPISGSGTSPTPCMRSRRKTLLGHARPFEDEFKPGNRGLPLEAALDKAKAEDRVLVLGLHGGRAENGELQAMCELRGIPFTGSGSASSNLAFDKVAAKRFAAIAGVAAPAGVALENLDAAFAEYGRLIAKPARDGSSYGLIFVNAKQDLVAVRNAARTEEYLIEPFVAGVEATCGVLEQSDGSVMSLPPVEIVPGEGGFDYTAKYLLKSTQEICPGRFSPEISAQLMDQALRAHRALSCSGYSRTDFIVSAKGPVYLETNTLPGLTAASLYPKALKAQGIEFADFLRDQIALAERRSRERV